MSTPLAELVAAHTVACGDLADAIRERAAARATEVRNRAEVYWRLNDGTRSATAIRQEVDVHAAASSADLLEQDGEIDAAWVEIRALEQQIAYATKLEGQTP